VTLQSYFDIDTSDKTAHFHGNLDTKTLGGAGFASQRTTGDSDNQTWDLEGYDGIQIIIADADSKMELRPLPRD